MAETIESVRVLDRASGRIEEMTAAECGFAYRTSVFKHRDRHVVLAVTFVLREDGRSGPLRYAELARAAGRARSAARRRWTRCARRCSPCAAARGW